MRVNVKVVKWCRNDIICVCVCICVCVTSYKGLTYKTEKSDSRVDWGTIIDFEYILKSEFAIEQLMSLEIEKGVKITEKFYTMWS